jgi:hypothetical protein
VTARIGAGIRGERLIASQAKATRRRRLYEAFTGRTEGGAENDPKRPLEDA